MKKETILRIDKKTRMESRKGKEENKEKRWKEKKRNDERIEGKKKRVERQKIRSNSSFLPWPIHSVRITFKQ